MKHRGKKGEPISLKPISESAEPNNGKNDATREAFKHGVCVSIANYRHEKRVTAVMGLDNLGLDNLGLDDALVICATYIHQHCAGDPPYGAFGDIRESAAWWAGLANPVELQCYFAAALKRLEYRALGIKARKRMFTVLWLAFTNTDRQAFLARVDAKGNFYRKGSA
ncbi:hypothetical protein OAN307_c17320 [Octadecabacter antarcticus 307]|uniref:Uncharacterized protein n=1 Tax=Octadecabacter antarcticus 307 TaxID=391626 RepID=M9R599_9RHOB|nr:hypothetical protein [Octadecabacter antarcticus]AGI67397.1 hypothetical protein OAN307_c17320 [Octadecabacter antarcticus 307]